MKKFFLRFSIILCLAILVVSFRADNSFDKVSVHVETKKLMKGKYVKSDADVFYSISENKMLIHYTYPFEYIQIANNKGETKVYDPIKNEVIIQADQIHSTKNDLLYLFFNNRISDLGLKDLGFRVAGMKNEDGQVITTYSPPPTLLESLQKVELVHKNMMPIYSAYYDGKGKIAQKIFYYEYQSIPPYQIPTKITSYDYMPNGDSAITKKTYTGFKTGYDAESPWFKYQIPSNAKVLKL